MSGLYRGFEFFEPPPSITETSIFRPQTLDFPFFSEEHELALDLFNPISSYNVFNVPLHCPFDAFETVTDSIHIENNPFSSPHRRIQRRSRSDLCYGSICDRLSGLELGFDRVVGAKQGERKYTWTVDIKSPEKRGGGDRKYKWTAVIESPEKDGADRKYKWTAEIKGGKKDGGQVKKESKGKWTSEIKGKEKGFAIKDSANAGAPCGGGALKLDKKKGSCATRAVEIEESGDHRAAAVRQALAKRRVIAKVKGKRKVLSPQDAAMMIQMNFRGHLIRRSQALWSLRELAVAKAKLKEIRALFNNFSYRHRIARDAEERQRFSERIIVVLLTVDAIQGIDLMVRASRRSMLDELEAMLDAVDPQPAGKLGAMRRRKFDLPGSGFQKDMAAGVAEVVHMLDQDEKYDNDTFEACL
ncbi:BAG family molecular chaperone regulator 7-like [Malania oleifera]|uniref:BAG family molecular chaperone regulator 7-like n=1 Tax=Malania oleifera TaxID=397392 RepID=UPI0025AE3EB6|nr:BAG family molecular chaperone regulator 7-like [Malania oleifera]